MFNLQGSEIIIVLLLALVVLGPEKLPDAMRKMGQAYAELKKMSSGFQSEFRAAVDEPMREIRDTANVLRDSADFTKLQDGERPEKPKSGEMADLAPADADQVPTDDTPTFDTPRAEAANGPGPATDSKPSPFADTEQDEAPSAERPPTGRTPIPAPPPPFSGVRAPVDPDAAPAEPDDAAVDPTATTAAEPAAPEAAGDVADPDGASTLDDEADTTR